MIKHFEEFRTDDDGTFYYYDDEKNENQWSYDLNELGKYITKNEQEIERLHSIIKEVREYIESKVMSSNEIIDGLKKFEVKEILQILDKVDKKNNNIVKQYFEDINREE